MASPGTQVCFEGGLDTTLARLKGCGHPFIRPTSESRHSFGLLLILVQDHAPLRLNAVEGFFAKLTERRLKRGVFRSVAEPQEAVLATVARGKQVLKLVH